MSLVLLFALLISINILLGIPEVEYHQHIGIILQLLFGIGSIYYSILVSRSGIKDSDRLHVEKPWYVEKTTQAGVMAVSFLFAFVLIIMNMIILGIGFAFIGYYYANFARNEINKLVTHDTTEMNESH